MTRVLLTCEHGGNAVPTEFRALFAGAADVLHSHRGWDPGALDLFEEFAPLAHHALAGTISRLVIELNRSMDSPTLFSSYTRDLPMAQRLHLLEEHYQPFRAEASAAVDRWRAEGMHVLHLSVHSFTPMLDGVERTVDIGLLHDPARVWERAICAAWAPLLREALPGLEVCFNEPYLGTDDGHTTALRAAHRAGYAGIELEVNQRFTMDGGSRMLPEIREALRSSFQRLLSDLPGAG